MLDASFLRWIPLLPLLSAGLHFSLFLFSRSSSFAKRAAAISMAAIVASSALALLALRELIRAPRGTALRDFVYPWIDSGYLSVDFSFAADALSVSLCVVTTLIALIVYTNACFGKHPSRPWRFFAGLDLLVAGTLLCLLSENLVFFFLGWQLIGVAAHASVELSPTEGSSSNVATSLGFACQRIGDAALLLAFLLLFWAFSDVGLGSADFRALEAAAATGRDSDIALGAVAAFFLVAIVVKGALFPLHTGLRRAATALVPTAALIHTVTVLGVAAYLVCRLDFVFTAVPEAAALMAWLGLAGAWIGGFLAWRSDDLRLLLSHATVSQMGLVFVALGCGAYAPALSHLLSHGVGKALLFLLVGCVIAAMQGEVRASAMGGLRGRIPRTHALFVFACLSLLGVPLIAGFASREALLVGVFQSELPGASLLHVAATGVVLVTALYTARMYWLVFAGESRADANLRSKIREPGGGVLLPLCVLAGALLLGGILDAHYGLWSDGSGQRGGIEGFIGGAWLTAGDPPTLRTERLLAVSHVCLTVLGIALAWGMRRLMEAPPRKAEGERPAFVAALERNFDVYELSQRYLLRPVGRLMELTFEAGLERRLSHWLGGRALATFLHGTARRLLQPFHPGLNQPNWIWMIAGTTAAMLYLAWSS